MREWPFKGSFGIFGKLLKNGLWWDESYLAFEEGIVECEEDYISEPSLMVFMGMGCKDTFDFGDALVTKDREDGGSAFQKIGAIINRYHITAALSHQGEWAGVAHHLKGNILFHGLIDHSFCFGDGICN